MKRRPFVVIAAFLMLFHLALQRPRTTKPLARWASEIHLEQDARIDGTVLAQRASEFSRTLLVQGEITVKGLPATKMSVLLTVLESKTRTAARNTQHEVCIGRRLIVRGRVRLPDPPPFDGSFSEVTYAKTLGAELIGRCYSTDVAWIDDAAGKTDYRLTAHNWIESQLEMFIGSELKPVAMAVLIGDKSKLSAAQKKWYSLSGTAHMFSVSGSHVAIVAVVVLVILGGSPRSWWKIAVLVIAVWTYVWISNMSAASVRAALMTTIVVFAVKTERSFDLLNILSAVVSIVLVVQPSTMKSAGFVMSVCATASILLLTPRWSALFKRCLGINYKRFNWLWDALSVNVAATVGTVIPIALYFGTVSMVSPFANLLVVPLLSLGMVLCLCTLAFAWVPGVATTIGNSARLCLELADQIALSSAQFNPDISAQHVVLVALGIAVLGIYPLVANTAMQLAVRSVICATVIAWIGMFTHTTPPVIESGYIQHGIAIQILLGDKRRIVKITKEKGLIRVRCREANHQ